MPMRKSRIRMISDDGPSARVPIADHDAELRGMFANHLEERKTHMRSFGRDGEM
jgi:hypothetical protein